MIKVLIVDDSAFMRSALTRMLEEDPEIKVIGQAGDGEEGFFFLGFGKSYAFQWIKEIEWRLPSDV